MTLRVAFLLKGEATNAFNATPEALHLALLYRHARVEGSVE
jgi:hypothetical protein